MKNATTDTRLPNGAEPALVTVVYDRHQDILPTLVFGGLTWHLEDVEEGDGMWFGNYSKI